jgi:tRNA threonylcarbamoyladenosine biosynthesis protein TsaB
MALILNINTAINPASVCLARDSNTLSFAQSTHQKDHASWLHLAVKQIIADAGVNLKDTEAIAVTAGPGSYTGLRIGLAAAKGLSFSLGIPLIAINLLEVMAGAIKTETANFYCPVVDARRMEVFMAVYGRNMETIIAPRAMIVKPDSFNSLQEKGKVIFIGDGCDKIKKVIPPSNAVFSEREVTAMHMVELSDNNFRDKRFADTAYSEPFYLKEFFSATYSLDGEKS